MGGKNSLTVALPVVIMVPWHVGARGHNITYTPYRT